MSLRGVLPLALLCVVSEVVAQSVAPGDEEDDCRDLRERMIIETPSYAPNMAILMDSDNYINLLPNRTRAVWQQVDNDVNNDPGSTTNWIQQSNSPCGQAVQVCGFSAGPQNNWLITQLINRTVNGTRLSQVSVLIEFELQGCDVTLNCQRTFNTHVYETSSVDSAAARNTNNYRQVERMTPSYTVTTGNSQRENQTVTINFSTDSSSFYFAVQDETSCIIVTRVIVFYTVCPAQAVDMISYPLTVAPLTGITIISTSCVENAEPVGAYSKVVCSADGSWNTFNSQCRCRPGAFSLYGACIQCSAGTYLSPSSGTCSPCPANSFSDRDGLAECICNTGFYRAPGEEDLPCRLPPTNVQVVERTEHSISLTWDPPLGSDAGDNIIYAVYTSVGNRPRTQVYRGTDTMTTIENLISGATYVVSVVTGNKLTSQVEEERFNTTAASVTVTVPGCPSNNTAIAIGVSVIVHLAFMLIIIATIVIFLFVLRKHLSHKNNSVDAEVNATYGEVKTEPARRSPRYFDQDSLATIGPNRHNSKVRNPVSYDLSDTSPNVAYGGVKLDLAVRGAVYEVTDSDYELLGGQPTMPVYATCKELSLTYENINMQ